MSEIHENHYPGWHADLDHPGYLIRYDPPMTFRAPYHVLPTFPTGEQLAAIWDLSRAIRSSANSVICISGSNVLRRVFDIVADVDFCEYLYTSGSTTFEKMEANLDGGRQLICLRLALGHKKWDYPWTADKPNEIFFRKTLNSADALLSWA